MTFSTLGTDTTTNQPVYLYKASRTQGLYIVGLQGMGKSGLLENLIIDDIKQGLGVCVLDPHGELIDHVIARLPGKAEEEKVIYLDLAEEDYFFGLNLFECADPTNNRKVSFTRSQVLHVFEKAYEVSQPATPRIYDYLFNTAYTLITNPGYTLLEIPLVFNAACRQKLLLNVSSEAVHKFWDDYKHLPQQKQDEEARELLRRLNDLSDDPLRYIVGQSQSTINLQKIMDGGKILLVKLSRRLEQATSLIGSIIVALILNASAARTTHKQFHLYADEFQRFATEDFATLLEEARKAGIGITMAHQNRAQLELSDKQADKQLKARTLNVGSLVVFRVPTDANELAGQFDTTPQEAWEQLIEEESVELLKEEWFEPITDVIEDGVEEIKTPVSNPFDWLVSGNSHSNPVVSRYADNTLRKIHLALPLNDPLRKIIRSELNSYLYRAMTSSDPLTFLCEKSSLNFLIRLNYVYPFGDYYFKETVVASLPEVETSLVSTGRYVRLPIGHIPEDAFHLMPALMAKKKGGIRDWSVDETMISTLTTMMRAIGDNEFHSASEQFARLAQMKLKTLIETYLAAYQKALKKKGYISDYLFTNALDLEAARCEQEFQSWMTEERAEFETFIKEFRDFVLALAKDPPETSSGLTKPRKRTQIHYLTHPRETITHPRKTIMHPQRTHADMQNEIEKELVHLPQYTARVKLTDANDTIAERTLATREPEKGLYGRLLEDRVERIKLHNRTAGYTRPRQEVEVEIKMRQNTLRQAQQLQVQKEPLSLQRRFLIEPQPVQPIASDSHLEQELMKLWREAVNKGLTSLKFEDWREQPEQKLLITWVKKLIGS